MRRTAMVAVTAVALALSGCTGDDATTAPPTPSATGGPDDAPATGDDPADGGTDAAPTTAPAGGAADDGAATAGGGTDVADATVDPDDVEGGAEGQAAADVAREFLTAMVGADAAACDHMVSFSDVQRPMADVEEDYELCTELLPVVLAEEVDRQGLDEEGPSVLEALEITGADVVGDTAVVDGDNFSPLFADSLGEETITLTRLEDRWYVDLDRSFQPPDPR